jgi:hypothetical protein
MTGYYIVLGTLLLVIVVANIWVDKQWKIDLENEAKEGNK